jgi:hypothetical protein
MQTPSSFATQSNYAQQPSNKVDLSNENYVYLRGLQANGYTGGTNFFFYYVESDLCMWPKNWTLAKKVTVGTAQPIGAYQNWAYARNPNASSTGQILVVDQPLLWTPDPLHGSEYDHYCTICWADNSTEANPKPPNFSRLGQMTSLDDLMGFLATHPNMGWLNTNDVVTPPPGQTFQTQISTQGSAETVNVTVNFYNITSGTFTINLIGDVSYSSGPVDVSRYQGGYQLPQQSFPANAVATLQVIGTPGNQSQYQRIDASIQKVISPSFMLAMEPMFANSSISLPVKKMKLMQADGTLGDVQDVFTLGSQTWNLIYNAPAPSAPRETL